MNFCTANNSDKSQCYVVHSFFLFLHINTVYSLYIGRKKSKAALKTSGINELSKVLLFDLFLFHLLLFYPLFQTSELELKTLFSSFGEAVDVKRREGKGQVLF